MSAEIEEHTGMTCELLPGGGGVFDVLRNGQVIFSKHAKGRFPEPGEIAAALGNDVPE